MLTMPKIFGKDTKFEKRELSLRQLFVGIFDEGFFALITLFALPQLCRQNVGTGGG
jgi:hypothetical protein